LLSIKYKNKIKILVKRNLISRHNQNKIQPKQKLFPGSGAKNLMRGFATLQSVLPLKGSREACNPHQAVYLTDVV
jgi:hypothetical protein